MAHLPEKANENALDVTGGEEAPARSDQDYAMRIQVLLWAQAGAALAEIAHETEAVVTGRMLDAVLAEVARLVQPERETRAGPGEQPHRRRPYRKVTPDERRAWRRLYLDEGMTILRIAVQYDRSTSVVAHHLRAMQIERRRQGVRPGHAR